MNKSSQSEFFQLKKVGIAILIVIHIVGVLGFLSPLSDWFVLLTPVSLIITAGMLWIDTQVDTYHGWITAVSIAILGYVVEIIGVNTGLLFGSYSYGDVLGWKFFNTPPIIGINWLIVIWGSYSMVFSLHIPKQVRWLLTALIATGLDYLIEPVAIQYQFWTWEGETPPLKNFATWFIISAVMALIFEKYPLVKKPRLGVAALICQILFFGTLLLYNLYWQ